MNLNMNTHIIIIIAKYVYAGKVLLDNSNQVMITVYMLEPCSKILKSFIHNTLMQLHGLMVT